MSRPPGSPFPGTPAVDDRLRDIYTISRLNREVKSVLEGSFPLLWVEGEISNFAQPASGHWYFSLKDEAAQVRCAMFRNRNRQVGFQPESGMQVLIRARIGLYEARGEFQIIAEHMEEAGDGALRRAFEALKHRLAAEGLFDAARKRPLPARPRRVGVVTSPSGAAIHDILTTLRRRFPALPVVIYPVPVQGEGAAEQIAEMLALAGRRADCDVLILARGGGSLEDLWAFNEEVVARAIHACPLPVVSGIGHEVDVTIADFVADQRAATPTAAAELISPDQQALRRRAAQLRQGLLAAMGRQLQANTRRLQWLHQRLVHPGRRLETAWQRLDELARRRHNAWAHLQRHRRQRLASLATRLQQASPARALAHRASRCQTLATRLAAAMNARLTGARARLQILARALDGVSPLATLERGYAIVTEDAGGTVLREAAAVRPGQAVTARLHRGRLHCTVTGVEDGEETP